MINQIGYTQEIYSLDLETKLKTQISRITRKVHMAFLTWKTRNLSKTNLICLVLL